MDASALASAESWVYWIGITKLVAALLVAVGVAAEFGGEWIVRPYEKLIADRRELEVLQLRQETATANARAAQAELQLAKLKAPRTLSVEQQERVVEKIKGFAGQKFAGQVASGVEDAWPLWQTLDRMLRFAGWTRTAPPGLAVGIPPAGVPISPSVGLTLFVDQSQRAAVSPAAEALAISLTAEGIMTMVAFGSDANTSQMADTIIIQVGLKPTQ